MSEDGRSRSWSGVLWSLGKRKNRVKAVSRIKSMVEREADLESLEEERVSMSKVEIYPVSTNNSYLGLWFQFRFIFV